MHWKRIVHSIITGVLVIFLIWYFLPDNKAMRATDVCGYYAHKTSKTCLCIPHSETGQSVSTIFYPNLSYQKLIPTTTKMTEFEFDIEAAEKLIKNVSR